MMRPLMLGNEECKMERTFYVMEGMPGCLLEVRGPLSHDSPSSRALTHLSTSFLLTTPAASPRLVSRTPMRQCISSS